MCFRTRHLEVKPLTSLRTLGGGGGESRVAARVETDHTLAEEAIVHTSRIASRRIDTCVVGHTEWLQLSLSVNGILHGQHCQEGAIEWLN